jgi:hypothetical protein
VVEGCKELVLGVYDRISGLFTQPIFGLIKEGPLGFVKGAGKGVLGLPVKFFAGMSMAPYLNFVRIETLTLQSRQRHRGISFEGGRRSSQSCFQE